jgi:hypothetical protein
MTQLIAVSSVFVFARNCFSGHALVGREVVV